MRWILLLLMTSIAQAADFKPFELKEASVTYREFQDGTRDPLYTLLPKTKEVETRINVDLFRYFFWDNRVHGGVDTYQFRVIGWNYKIGARLAPWLDVQYEHHSQHLMDSVYPFAGYPVEDSLGFTLYFYRDINRRSILK